MPKKLGIIAVHGMGDTPSNFSEDLEDILRQEIGSINWRDIHFGTVYYQDILQENQRRVWKDMQLQSSTRLRGSLLRRFMLYGFSDASSLEHKADEKNSVYKQTQKKIAKSLDDALTHLVDPKTPVIVIAQSLGGQVISNYIWDAQQNKSIFDPQSPDFSGAADNVKKFLSLETMRYLFTTGCNIPLFVAGFNKIESIDKSKMHPDFQWLNYYDRDDVLGWPLQPLSDQYDQLVKDIEINAGNPFIGFTPFSHNNYWSDRDFIKPLITNIMSIISQQHTPLVNPGN